MLKGLNHSRARKKSANLNPGLNILIQTQYLPEHSNPKESQFVFAYTVTFSNHGKLATRVLGRQWILIDANDKVEQFDGEGVVGCKPLLEPRQYFRYTSAAILSTPIGTMQGSYSLIREDGKLFEAVIPAFRLAVPSMVN